MILIGVGGCSLSMLFGVGVVLFISIQDVKFTSFMSRAMLVVFILLLTVSLIS